MSERDFGLWLEDACRTFGWAYYHTWNSKNSAGGWPDYVLSKGPRLIFVELKSAKGKLTDAQSAWLIRLTVAGQETYVWRPENQPEIVALLSEGRAA